VVQTKKPACAGLGGAVGDGLRFTLTMLVAPVVAWALWSGARRLGAWVADQLPDGPMKDMLTKRHDYGGY
jgi:ABC-type uncharacterized transport system permease subunit